MGIDDTVERRKGKRIRAKGIYRDAVRSSDSQVVKVILMWFRQRWQVEVTFEEVRAHLGVETQRQWSDQAILRTTPALFGLFSLVTLFAHALQMQKPFSLTQTDWLVNLSLPFIDAFAAVRCSLWSVRLFEMHQFKTTQRKKFLQNCYKSGAT